MGLKEKMADAMMGKMDAADKQEMMSAMMDKFFSEMSGEEKQKLMEAMMDKFMAGLSADDKQKMMKTMMPKMMGGAEGGSGMKGMMMGKKNPMMEMMSGMMGCGEGEGAGEDAEEGEKDMPWDMCKKMMAAIGKSSDLATFATPEVRELFEEWAGQIEAEILALIKETGASDPNKIAERFKLSTDSVHYFLNRLAQKGKISLKAEQKT